MATIAEQIAEAEAELTALKAQIVSAQSGGQSMSVDGMSISRVNYSGMAAQRTMLEKRIQRLKRGGRGFVIDASYGSGI